jgi:hypothetical protein
LTAPRQLRDPDAMGKTGGVPMAVAMAAALASGCVYRWGDATQTTTKSTQYRGEAPRKDRLLGAGTLEADGHFRYVVDVTRLCQAERIVTSVPTTTTHKRFTLGGMAVVATSVATVGTGAYMAFAPTDPNAPSGGFSLRVASILPNIFGRAGFVLLMIGRYSDVLDQKPLSIPTTGTPVVRNEGLDDVRCAGGAAVLGKLELTTPWGTSATATPAADGGTSFTVDWSAEVLDPTSPEGRAQVAQPWRIASGAMGLDATWSPAATDVKVINQLLARARDQIITGTTPAELVTTGLTVDGGALLAGAVSTVRLTVENRGGTSALEVSAKTRSSLAALHNLTFSFGKVQPGKRVTQSAPISLPADTAGGPATIVLVFREAGGHVPADLTQQLMVNAGVCPAGTLTRAKYDQKRAALLRSLDAGSISRADFDKFDAELVRCLE